MTAEQYKTDALPVPEQGTASYRNIHQLFKKLPHGEEIHNIFPVTYTQSVYDGKTGANLEHILHQFNHIFLQFQGTPQATRNLLPKDMRRKGIMISYRNMDNNVVTETNIDESESTSDNWGLDKYWAVYSISLDQIIKVIEDYIDQFFDDALKEQLESLITEVVKLNPDDLDKNSDNQIQLADRDSTNGMGYVILRKNKTLAEQVTKENTIYEIRYDYDLDGGEVTIPEGCVLDFQGGSFSNGVIIGNRTDIKEANRSLIFSNIKIQGTWKVANIYSEWFNLSTEINYDNTINIQNLCNLTSDNYFGNIYISGGPYYVSIPKNRNSVMLPNSNTIINIDGSIILNPTETGSYKIIYILDKECITIRGNGIISGDVETHIGSDGEWGHCIHILGGLNCNIENLNLNSAWGDSVSIDSSEERRSENIYINNIKCKNSRRQGLSIEGVNKAVITNCFFDSIYMGVSGTNPGAAIDIEPWRDGEYAEDIYVENCTAINCRQGFSVVGLIKNVTINNCRFRGNNTENYVDVFKTENPNLIYSNCDFRNCFNIKGNVKITSCNLGIIDFRGGKLDIYNSTIDTLNNTDGQLNYFGGVINVNNLADEDEHYINVTDSILHYEIPVSVTNSVLFINGRKNNVSINFNNSLLDFASGNTTIISNVNIYNSTINLLKSLALQNSSNIKPIIICNCTINYSSDSPSLSVYKGYSSEYTGENLFEFIGNTINTHGKNLQYYVDYDTSALSILYYDNKMVNNPFINYSIYYKEFFAKFAPSIKNSFTINNGYYPIGDTNSRPLLNNHKMGYQYYDTDLKKTILWNGTAWVNMDGTALAE